jgi:RHS repeat-associated protein
LTRSSSDTLPTDRLFTGQRLDGTGLYFYNARYYDPEIGRFISPDIYVQDFTNPQSLNRYSYVLNNPLKYTDPSGHWFDLAIEVFSIGFDIQQLISDPSWGNAGYLALDVGLAFIPFVPGITGVTAKGVSHSDDVFKAVKDVASQLDNIKDAFKMGIKNPWNFRGKLQKLTGMSDEMAKGMESHHVLPQTLKDKFQARFGDGFDINNPFWGAWVKKGEHQKWSYRYQKDWEQWLIDNPKAKIEEVMDFAKKLGNDPRYGFKVTWAE